MPNKSEIRCFKRWQQLQKGSVVEEAEDENFSSHWTREEDALLAQRVKDLGTRNWIIIAEEIPGRLGRQCRERWYNKVNPNITKSKWTKEEDEFLLQMFKEHGSKWSKISKMDTLLGRTISQIKNRFYQNLMKKEKLNGLKPMQSEEFRSSESTEDDVNSEKMSYMKDISPTYSVIIPRKMKEQKQERSPMSEQSS